MEFRQVGWGVLVQPGYLPGHPHEPRFLFLRLQNAIEPRSEKNLIADLMRVSKNLLVI
jgi:hypothetical protein